MRPTAWLARKGDVIRYRVDGRFDGIGGPVSYEASVVEDKAESSIFTHTDPAVAKAVCQIHSDAER